MIWAFSAMLLGCKGETYQKNGSCAFLEANLIWKDVEELLNAMESLGKWRGVDEGEGCAGLTSVSAF